MNNTLKTGILLVNLGTPTEPTIPAVRSYLREFLSDPKVINLTWIVRALLVNLILLTRVEQSTKAYQAIWLREGSPLLVYTSALGQALAKELGDQYSVEIAMRYGFPSIAEGLRNLKNLNCEKLVILPLFPQYSNAVTGSVIAAVNKTLKKAKITLPVEIIYSFTDDPNYIAAFAESCKKTMNAMQAEYLLMSYHGLPERQMHYNPNYQQECFESSEAIANALSLTKEQYQTSFQSRLGRTPWIPPYTDQVLIELRAKGIKRLAIVCPSFVVDCLETLEEIGIRAREQWLNLGGEAFQVVPCLNASECWVKALATRLKKS